MSILTWILLGLVAGYIAKKLHPGPTRSGLLPTLFIGIIGALLGGFLGRFTFWGDVDGFNLGSIAIATMGAVLALWLRDRFL